MRTRSWHALLAATSFGVLSFEEAPAQIVVTPPSINLQTRIGNTLSPPVVGVQTAELLTDYRDVVAADVDIGTCPSVFGCTPIVEGEASARGDAGFQLVLGTGAVLGFPGMVEASARVQISFSPDAPTSLSNRVTEATGQVRRPFWLVRQPLPAGQTYPDDYLARMRGQAFLRVAFDAESVGSQIGSLNVSVAGAGFAAELRLPSTTNEGGPLEVTSVSSGGLCAGTEAAFEAALRLALESGGGLVEFCFEVSAGGGNSQQTTYFPIETSKVVEVLANATGGTGSGTSFDPSRVWFGSSRIALDPIVEPDTEALGAYAPFFELAYPTESYPQITDLREALDAFDPETADLYVAAMEDFYGVDLTPAPEPGAALQGLFACAALAWSARRASRRGSQTRKD